MTRKIQILVVEDEAAIRVGLIDVFTYHGYEVDYADEGVGGLNKSLSGKYDLIILDVMLPGMDGFQICEKIREQDRQQPIIMLTAKTGDDDIIQGLSLGADDYVAKPFSVAQLVLRVKAVLRRSQIGNMLQNQIQLGEEICIDIANLSATSGKKAISFTKREMEIIQYLKQHQDRPVPREELLSKIWGYAKNLNIETRTVDIHMAKIRRKIEKDPGNPEYLVTIRGAGYKLFSE